MSELDNVLIYYVSKTFSENLYYDVIFMQHMISSLLRIPPEKQHVREYTEAIVFTQ